MVTRFLALLLVSSLFLSACKGKSTPPPIASDAGHDAAAMADAGGATPDSSDDVDAGQADARPSDPIAEPWARGPEFPYGVDHHTTAVLELSSVPYLYVFGGITVDPTGQPETVHDRVFRARINADGTLSDWEEQEPLPFPLGFQAITVHPAGYVVLIGGISTNPDGSVAVSPYMIAARLQEDGELSPWFGPRTLPKPVLHGTATTIGERIYLAGGGAGRTSFNDDVYSWALEVDAEGAGFSDIRAEASLPTERSHHAHALVDGRWYLFGGMAAGNESRKILRAEMDGDEITGWTQVGTWDTPAWTAAAAVDGDDVLLVGGGLDFALSANIYRVEIGEEVTVHDTELQLPYARAHVHQTPIFAGALYSVGGRIEQGGEHSAADVYFAQLP